MKALQDMIPNNHCYGCGPDNPDGLRIKSYLDGDISRCTYQPRPEQCAGPTNYLYGGTIASLIDCHSVCTAMAAFYKKEGREVGAAPTLWCVTGKLTINYRLPTPIDKPVELEASIAEMNEKKAIVNCQMFSEGKLTAEAEVIAVRVPDSWTA